MKPQYPALFATAAALLMITLAGCTTGHAQQNKAHHSDTRTAPPAKPADKTPVCGMGMTQAPTMDMCAGMHEKIMSAKTPEERKALMQEHMKSLSPEMRQRMQAHMDSMSCK